MSPRGEAFLEVVILFLLLVLGCLVYVVSTWPTSPMQVVADIDQLGPWAFLIDVLFLGVLVRFWRKSKPPVQETVWK